MRKYDPRLIPRRDGEMEGGSRKLRRLIAPCSFTFMVAASFRHLSKWTPDVRVLWHAPLCSGMLQASMCHFPGQRLAACWAVNLRLAASKIAGEHEMR